ncbi:MAG: phospholipase A, partial [Gammaproteobacteria bacterium]|nr:phospholipase A [Gammaproteobacteria bacterium]
MLTMLALLAAVRIMPALAADPQQYDLFADNGSLDSAQLEEVIRREAERVLGERIKKYSHEPSSFGYTFDGNDENFLDIKISFKYSPFDNGLSKLDRPAKSSSWRWNLPYLYFAFSMRQAFYVETERDSNPVIGQRFNPEMFARYWLNDGGYLDFGYNHESNGQSITSAEAFTEKQNEFIAEGKSTALANEFISRGWDYWELTYKNNINAKRYGYEGFSYYLILRRFLSEGLLQDGVEEV